MYMPYTTNPHLPRVRRDAVRLVCYRGWSIRKVARHIGVNPSTVSRWIKKDPTGGWRLIETKSSRPHSHPRKLSKETEYAILEYREKHKRCAEVLHHLLVKDGYEVSVSSIKRILRRYGLVNHSKWKKWHQYPPRPLPEKPGVLVEIDTIYDGFHTDRLYVYTMLDVCSRWAHALPVERISTHESLRFVKRALDVAPFPVSTLQSDHGSEFSKYFTKQVNFIGMSHRHSRIRRPTDNGHLERFNRTIQEECLRYVPRNLRLYRKAVCEYLEWYNEKRPHMALNMKTPAEVLRSY